LLPSVDVSTNNASRSDLVATSGLLVSWSNVKVNVSPFPYPTILFGSSATNETIVGKSGAINNIAWKDAVFCSCANVDSNVSCVANIRIPDIIINRIFFLSFLFQTIPLHLKYDSYSTIKIDLILCILNSNTC